MLVSLAQNAGVALLLTAVLGDFWRVYRAGYLGWWTAAQFIRFLAGLVTVATAAATGITPAAGLTKSIVFVSVAASVYPILMLFGTWRVARDEAVPRPLLYSGTILALGPPAVAVLVAWTAPPADPRLVQLALLPGRGGTFALCLTVCAALLLRGTRRRQYSVRLLAAAFLCEAATAGYFVVRQLGLPESLAEQILPPASVLFSVLTGVAMVVMLLEYERRQRSTLVATLESAFANSTARLVTLDLDLRITGANANTREFFDRFLRPLRLGDNVLDYDSPPDRETWVRRYARALAGESFEVRDVWRSHDGTEVAADRTLCPIVVDGKVTGVMIIALDATESHRLQQEIARREERFRSLIDSTSDVITSFDPRGVLRFVSPACAPLTGWDPEQLVGTSLFDYVHPDDRDALRATLSSDAVAKHPRQHVFRMRSRHGRWLEFESLTRLVRGPSGSAHFVAALRDLSDRRRLESQLLQAQKMESMGQLAGGIAHDFNNLLTAVIGYAEFWLERDDLDPELRGDLTQIKQAADAAAELTRQLLTFSRRHRVQPQTLHLNALLTDTRALLSRVIGERVTLDTSLATDLGVIQADPNQLQQVVMNLAVNARDAMPEGGTLRLVTSRICVPADGTARPDVEPGDYVQLTVSDTGMGIPEDVLPHIFEPFFTTKGQGKGTGLGLATTYGIVRQAGGHVWVDSRPGTGTTFTLWFPTATSHHERTNQEERSVAASGTERVLVVEDDARVRQFAQSALSGLGYRVAVAGSGEEALACLGAGLVIDALVTDVVMPGMGGRRLFDRLRRENPTLPVLFVTGYTDDDTLRAGRLPGPTALLQKPFNARELGGALRQLLDGPQATARDHGALAEPPAPAA